MARDAALKAKNQIEKVEGILEREKKKDARLQRLKKRKPLRRS
tara:strand:+ start:122 stop:250 length:129 start_codon:yes stop_codon:yes gene_type:complete